MDLSIDSITQLSPPIALALFLNFVGYGIKKSAINNLYIPLILIVMGAFIYPFIADVEKTNTAVRNPFLLEMIYGACIAGLSVAGHQTVKGFIGKDKSDDTQFITKDKP